MKKIKLIASALAALITITVLAGCSPEAAVNDTNTTAANSTTLSTAQSIADMRDITTMDVVKEMGIGINLGNTFESCGDWINNSSVTNYETGWGSPVITEDIIKGYKNSGYGVLRVPVAWSNMMGENYTINADYMARVKEVVTLALDSEMYVILNIHWDSGWWEDFPTDKDECMKKYTRIWEQICENFNEFDDYLMFESLNEEGGWDSLWNRYSNSGDKEASYGLLNEINQTFVDVVRGSGENNEKRHLLIAGYATDVQLTCDELFVMPNDSQKRCAVSIHYYTPSTFAILEADADWGKAQTEWGSEKDYNELNKHMDMLKETFIDKDIPVIMGEYGCSTKNKTEDMIRLYMSSVCESAYTRGICPVLWDITDVSYNRTSCEMNDSKLMEEFIAIRDNK